MNETDTPLPVQLMQMIASKWVAKPIYAVAKLGIADLVKQQPQTAAALAQATGVHAASLYRVLRALASVGIFAETDGRFETTPMAQLLESGPKGLRAMAIMFGEPWHERPWSEFLHCVKTGEPAFERTMGMRPWPYLQANPDAAAVFNEAMTGNSLITGQAIAESYPFDGVTKLVDVGGGHGFLLQTVLNANPKLRGVLFDLPSVVAGAEAVATAGERCEIVPGDFFEAVAVSADAYCLKHILHDWSDDRCLQILKNIQRAAPANARLLVFEMVIPPGNEPFPGKLLDLEMLVLTDGGRERTETEYRGLLAESGWKLNRIVPTKAAISIVEAIRM